MSNVKNYGLNGVASTLQLGKKGSTLSSEANKIVAKTEAGALTQMQAADPVAANDVVTKQFLQTYDGMGINLGTPTDSTLTGGAVELQTTTKVTDAVDMLNGIMGKLIPKKPNTFPGTESLSILSTQSALLASGGVPDNTNGGSAPFTVAAGSAVNRVTTTTINTNTLGSATALGPGNAGRLYAFVNGTPADDILFTDAAETKTSGVLRVTSNADYPVSTPGFWKNFQTNITGASVSTGWNRVKLMHDVNGTQGNTNDAYVVYDPMTNVPVITNSANVVQENTPGTLAYSSGIPHYNNGTLKLASVGIQKLVGETYKAGNILGVGFTNSISGSYAWGPGANGLASVLARNTPMVTVLNYVFDLAPNGTNGASANVHAKGQVTFNATNMNGTSTVTFPTNVLVKRGTTTNVDEMSIPVSIAANGGPSSVGSRVIMGSGTYPSTDKSALTTGDWVSSATPATHEAAVVGGILQHDVTDYTTSYLPVGPSRAAYDATSQYMTFMFRRTAVSKFDISLTGSYTSVQVKLVGVSEATTTSANGWYTMSSLYSGAGYPGDTGGGNGSLGCALGAVTTGSTGSFTCTFGTKSTTNATNNMVLVRIKLSPGQSLSAISITPATR